MNKQSVLSLCSLIIMAIISVGMSSCSKDKDDEITINSPIVGTWEEDYEHDGERMVITFTAERTFSITFVGTNVISRNTSGTYDIVGQREGTLVIHEAGENRTRSARFSIINDNRLIMIDDANISATFHRK